MCCSRSAKSSELTCYYKGELLPLLGGRKGASMQVKVNIHFPSKYRKVIRSDKIFIVFMPSPLARPVLSVPFKAGGI